MAVSADIVQSWRQPRAVMRRHLARGRSEPFVFSLLVAFLLLAFVAQWPVVQRQALLLPDRPLVAGLVAVGLALLASIPVFYGLAALSQLALRLRQGFYAARLALFMALLAVSPVVLLHGLVQGMIGPGLQSQLVGGVAFVGFVAIWVAMLREAAQ